MKVSSEMQPIAFVDSNSALQGTYLGGLKIIHPRKLEKMVSRNKEKIIQIASDLWIHEDYHKKLVIQLTSFFKTNSQLSISEFKSLTLTTRKNAIPLLEFCDKNELTIREDNFRVKGKEINV